MKKIDFVISVRNRDNPRIQRCINSLKSKYVNRIYIIDYGSKTPIQVNNAEIIKIDKDKFPVWNKSHALNIGIKKCKSEYIGTIDCDIVLSNNFLKKVYKFLKEDVFLFTRKVYRVDCPEIFDWKLKEEQIMKLVRKWLPNMVSHEGVGGIQIFSRRWIHKIKGYDENMTYWGGMDNDMYERAIRDKIPCIDINQPIFHQEHENKKEDNLESNQEKAKALDLRMKRRNYLNKKESEGILINEEPWGDENEVIVEEENCGEIEEILSEISENHKDFMINGVKYHIFDKNETEKENINSNN